jgi:hypothetical protein
VGYAVIANIAPWAQDSSVEILTQSWRAQFFCDLLSKSDYLQEKVFTRKGSCATSRQDGIVHLSFLDCLCFQLDKKCFSYFMFIF